MNAQTLLPILNMILSLIPSITNSKAINQIVAWLLQIEPVIVQFAQDLGPVIKNIVAAFASNPATNASQMAALKVLDAQVDKAFDDAFADYLANHPDPAPAPSASVQTSSAAGSISVPLASSAETTS